MQLKIRKFYFIKVTMKEQFCNIVVILWILTLYCNVTNGDWSDEKSYVYKQLRNFNLELTETKNQLSKKDDQIELLKLEVEELKLRTAPKSCTELTNQNINRDQSIFIDVDGINYGFKPTKANCSFPTNKITFGENQQIDFNPSEEAYSLTYDEAMLNQIKMTIENSASCTQTWTFKCYESSLNGNSVSIIAKIH